MSSKTTDQLDQAADVKQKLAGGSDKALWDEAVRQFREETKQNGWMNEGGELDKFVSSMEDVEDARKTCVDVQTKADKKYLNKELKIGGKTIISSTFLKTTLANLDTFIKLGDVATKGGAETVSVAWSCIKLVLQAFQADAQFCEMWAQAAECMSRILLTCRTLAKLYSASRPDDTSRPADVVVDLLGLIPRTYKAILSFSWAAKLQLKHNRLHRFFSEVNPFSRSAGASAAAFEQIKDSDKLIRDQAQIAFQQITRDGQNALLDGQGKLAQGQEKTQDKLNKLMDIVNQSGAVLDEHLQTFANTLNTAVEKFKPQSQEDFERNRFEENKKQLAPSRHSLEMLRDKLEHTERGTCRWIFDKDVTEFHEWCNSTKNECLWVWGRAGVGKSYLIASVIEYLQTSNGNFEKAEEKVSSDTKSSDPNLTKVESANGRPHDATPNSDRAFTKQTSDAKVGTHEASTNEPKTQTKLPLVAYFFCKNTGEDFAARSVIRLRQDIVYRIYDAIHTDEEKLAEANRIFTKADSKSKRKGGGKREIISQQSTFSTANSLKTAGKLPDMDDAFIELAKILDRPIYVVVDALDECTDLRDERLLDTFTRWTEEQSISVKIIASSRPESYLQEVLLDRVPSVDVQKYNQRDIERRTDAELKRILNLSPIDRRKIRNRIVNKAQSQFTYVEIAMEFLRQPWRYPIENVLNKLSDNVQKIYQESLRSTDPSYMELAKLALKWTLLRQGTLSVKELFDVYSQRFLASPGTPSGDDHSELEDSISLDDSSDDDDQSVRWDPESLFLEQIKIAARNLVLVQGDDKHLEEYHYTVKETFLQTDPNFDIHEEDEIHDKDHHLCDNCKNHTNHQVSFYVRGEDHLDIVIILLRHLRSNAFQEEYFPYALPPPKDISRTASTNDDNASNAASDPDENVTYKSVNKRKDRSDQDSTDPDNDLDDEDQTEGSVADNNHGSENGFDDQSTEQRTVKQDDASPTTEEKNGSSGKEVKNADENLDEGQAKEDATKNNSQHTSDDIELDYDRPISEDDEDDIISNRGGPNSVYDECKHRYEVVSWPLHVKAAEDAIKGQDLSLYGHKYDEFWEELSAFFNDDGIFKWWAKRHADYSATTDNPRWYLRSYNLQPLHVAASFGLKSVCKRLIDEGASLLTMTEIDNYIPLAALRHNESLNEDPELLDLMLEKTIVGEGDDMREYCQRVLSESLLSEPSVEIVERILKWHQAHGFDPNVVDEAGDNPFHFLAYRKARPGVVELLRKYGVDIKATNKDKRTPLHILLDSINIDYTTLEAFLSHGADPNIDSDFSERPLAGAARSGDRGAAEMLIKAGADVEDPDNEGWLAIHNAAYNGKRDMVQFLHCKSPHINHPTKKGELTPFYLACRGGDQDTALYIFNQIVHLPLAEIDRPTSISKKTPFRKACFAGFTELVQSMIALPGFIEEGRLNFVDLMKGWSPLHVAALKGNKEVIRLLLDYGAKISLTDVRGKTPLQTCCERWTESSKMEFEDAILHLIDADEEAAKTDVRLLHVASIKGSTRVVERLLNAGIHRSAEDVHGWTARTYARSQDNHEIVRLLDTGGVVGNKPSKLAIHDEYDALDFDESTCLYKHAENKKTTYGSALTDHPIPSGQNQMYFEVTVEEGTVFIGYSTYTDSTRRWLPGFSKRGVRSWGYHGDSGEICTHNRRYSPVRARFAGGVVVGAFYERREKQHTITFVHNGYDIFSMVIDPPNGPLYPVVGFEGKASASINLGQEPFMALIGFKDEPASYNKAPENLDMSAWSSRMITQREGLRFMHNDEVAYAAVILYDKPITPENPDLYFEVSAADTIGTFDAFGISSYVAKTDGWYPAIVKPGTFVWIYCQVPSETYNRGSPELLRRGRISTTSTEFLLATEESPKLPSYAIGNVLGCGVMLNKNIIYFTVNGRLVFRYDKAFTNLNGMKLFPTVGLPWCGVAEFNFGEEKELKFKGDPMADIEESEKVEDSEGESKEEEEEEEEEDKKDDA